MANSNLIRYSGAAAVLAGISGAAVTILGQNQPSVPIWISVISLFTSLIALYGLYQYQKAEAGNLGLIGFILAMTGSILLNLDVLIELTGVVYALGLIMLAVASLQVGKFPRWASWMWIASPIIGFSGVLLVNIEILLFSLGSLAFGLGFIGYGISMWNKVEPSST